MTTSRRLDLALAAGALALGSSARRASAGGHLGQQAVRLVLDLGDGRLDQHRLDAVPPERGRQVGVEALLAQDLVELAEALGAALLQAVEVAQALAGLAEGAGGGGVLAPELGEGPFGGGGALAEGREVADLLAEAGDAGAILVQALLPGGERARACWSDSSRRAIAWRAPAQLAAQPLVVGQGGKLLADAAVGGDVVAERLDAGLDLAEPGASASA